jgi:hypothetical protein
MKFYRSSQIYHVCDTRFERHLRNVMSFHFCCSNPPFWVHISGLLRSTGQVQLNNVVKLSRRVGGRQGPHTIATCASSPRGFSMPHRLGIDDKKGTRSSAKSSMRSQTLTPSTLLSSPSTLA